MNSQTSSCVSLGYVECARCNELGKKLGATLLVSKRRGKLEDCIEGFVRIRGVGMPFLSDVAFLQGERG